MVSDNESCCQATVVWALGPSVGFSTLSLLTLPLKVLDLSDDHYWSLKVSNISNCVSDFRLFKTFFFLVTLFQTATVWPCGSQQLTSNKFMWCFPPEQANQNVPLIFSQETKCLLISLLTTPPRHNGIVIPVFFPFPHFFFILLSASRVPFSVKVTS